MSLREFLKIHYAPYPEESEVSNIIEPEVHEQNLVSITDLKSIVQITPEIPMISVPQVVSSVLPTALSTVVTSVTPIVPEVVAVAPEVVAVVPTPLTTHVTPQVSAQSLYFHLQSGERRLAIKFNTRPKSKEDVPDIKIDEPAGEVKEDVLDIKSKEEIVPKVHETVPIVSQEIKKIKETNEKPEEKVNKIVNTMVNQSSNETSQNKIVATPENIKIFLQKYYEAQESLLLLIEELFPTQE